MAVTDEEVRESVGQWLVEEAVEEGNVWKVLETAGGVASPGPSGTLQCDLYRCVCLPLLGACLTFFNFSEMPFV